MQHTTKVTELTSWYERAVIFYEEEDQNLGTFHHTGDRYLDRSILAVIAL